MVETSPKLQTLRLTWVRESTPAGGPLELWKAKMCAVFQLFSESMCGFFKRRGKGQIATFSWFPSLSAVSAPLLNKLHPGLRASPFSGAVSHLSGASSGLLLAALYIISYIYQPLYISFYEKIKINQLHKCEWSAATVSFWQNPHELLSHFCTGWTDVIQYVKAHVFGFKGKLQLYLGHIMLLNYFQYTY